MPEGTQGSNYKGNAVAAAVLTAAGCASTPIPNEKIAVAKASVQRAEQSGAPEFAPVELAAARDKLSRAEKSAAAREAQPATMLAEQADADARLAEALTLLGRSFEVGSQKALAPPLVRKTIGAEEYLDDRP